MEKKRVDELTKKMLKMVLARHGNIKIVSAGEYRRDVGKFAKEAGISLKEVFVFVNPLVREMFEEMLDQSEFLPKEEPQQQSDKV